MSERVRVAPCGSDGTTARAVRSRVWPADRETGACCGARALRRSALVRGMARTIAPADDDEGDRDGERRNEPHVRRDPPVRRDGNERWKPAERVDAERGIEHVLHPLLERVVQRAVRGGR